MRLVYSLERRKEMRMKTYLLTICTFATFLFPMTAAADLMSSLEQLSPVPITYSLGSEFQDFRTILEGGLTDPAFGDVTGLLQYVGDGNELSDFSSFVAGNIALIQRGSAYFSTKINNAQFAGAIGAIIFDNVEQSLLTNVSLYDQTFIPALLVTNSLGLQLVDVLRGGSVLMHMTVAAQPVPEPVTMFLIGTGIAGLAGVRSRRKKSNVD